MSAEKPSSTKVNVHVKTETGEGKTKWVQEERELDHDDFAAYMRLHNILDGVKAHALNYYLSGATPEERAQRLADISDGVQSLPSGGQCSTDEDCAPGFRCDNGTCVPK